MMKHLLLLLLLFICAAPITVTAQQTEAHIVQKISRATAAMKTMQCDFTQTKHLKMLNEEMVSSGKMYYRQANQLRWEYVKPYSYIFVLNNDKVYIKNQKRQDVIDVNQNKLFKEITRIMMNSVVGNYLTDQKSFQTHITTKGDEWIATLTPKRRDMKQMFQQIVLHFSQRHSAVTLVDIIEKNGDKTVITLKNIIMNETISTHLFTLH